MVIDEIDSFSRSGQKKTSNERDFNRLLKLITNDGDIKSKLKVANKNVSSTKQREENNQSPSAGRNKRKQRKDESPIKHELDETTFAVSIIGIANSVELFRGELNTEGG